jgi:Protein of unknown function (DUF3103)
VNPRAFRIALSVTAMAVVFGAVAIPSEAAPSPAPPDDSVAAVTDRLAKELATDARAGLFSAAAAKPVNLAATHGDTALDSAVSRANREVLAAKGLPDNGPSLLQLRLARPGMRAAAQRGDAPLVASAPSDDSAGTVTAYARDGAKVSLDARKAPSRPVFVVEVDAAKALPLGVSVMRRVFDQRGVGEDKPVHAADGYWATQVQSVRLNDDKEPWVKGDAEIFGIAGGFGMDGKAAVNTLTMPYLDNDGSTYYPGQLIVHFSAYKYNLADFVMMEDDGDTNYQQLAIAIADALLTIVDGGAYVPLVNAILNALPASWWTDDPDYVDSWYTLSTTSSGTLNGAAGNGTMTVAPYWVAPV